MKRLLSLLLLVVATLGISAQTTKLPVLKVNVDGKFSKTMTDYLLGSMELTDTDGSTVTMPAKFKIRGATAAEFTGKPSLNMKLRDATYENSADSALLGMRSCSSWILDAMAIDRICMRNRVAMDMWNEYAQLPYETDFDSRNGTIGRYVEVYFNGTKYGTNKYMGVYVLSDRINRKLLNLKKYDEDNKLVRGVLYKNGTEDISNQNERNFTTDWKAGTIEYHNAWELKEPEDYECEAAWQPLVDAFDNIKTYAMAKKYFYLDNLVDFELLTVVLAIEDNWGNKNHYFSIRNIQKNIDDADATEAARRKFVITPWDLDTSFGGAAKGERYTGGQAYSEWTMEQAVNNGGCFPFPLCLNQTEYKNLLKNRWLELRQKTFAYWNVRARLYAYRDLLLNSGVYEKQKSVQPKYVADLTTEVDAIVAWYTTVSTRLTSTSVSPTASRASLRTPRSMLLQPARPSSTASSSSSRATTPSPSAARG